MISFTIKKFTLPHPAKMGVGETVSVYGPHRANVYLRDSVRTEPAYGAYRPEGMRVLSRRGEMRTSPPGVFDHSGLGTGGHAPEARLYTLMKENRHVVGKIKEVQGMAKVRKTQITWDAVDSPDVVGYRLYWAVGGGVDYSSEFFEVGNVTKVLLPDDVPSFPLIAGDIEIGVTAVNQRGNESDISVFSAPFDFTSPRPPGNIMVRDL